MIQLLVVIIGKQLRREEGVIERARGEATEEETRAVCEYIAVKRSMMLIT